MNSFKIGLTSTCMLAGILAGTHSYAQDSEPAADERRLQAVVITANKRSEDLQDVPLAVTAVSEDDLQLAGVTDFSDLAKVSPSLRIRPAQHPGNANISLRGVGTFALSIGVESSVAVLIDEVPLAFQARAFTNLPAVERIEVLRGPQSTLYGKSASAGLINMVTKSPTRDFMGDASARITNDGEYAGDLTVSGPINDTLSYILSGSYTRWDGNVYNVTRNEDVNRRESGSLRGKLLWEPNSDVAITLSGNYNSGDSQSGMPFIRIDPNALYLGIPGFTPDVALPGVIVSEENDKTVDNFASGTDYSGFGGYLRGEFTVLGDHQLVSITSYDDFELNDYVDQDQTATGTIFSDNLERGTFSSKLFTQEVRLLSPDAQDFRYTLGAYYANTQIDRPFYRGPVFALSNWFATSESQQASIFGQLDWDATDRLTLTGGVRLQQEEVSYTYLDILNGNAYFEGSDSDTAATYRTSARYAVTDDINVFASYATGYKGQTYDLTTGFDAARQASGPVKPETSEAFELGVRAQFFDRMLTTNLTYFDASYTDLQAQSIETNGTTQNFRLTNVGELVARGVEAELAYLPTDDLSFNGSITYLDAEYASFPNARCYTGQTAAQGCTGSPPRQDLSGTQVPASEWNFTASANYQPRIKDDMFGIASASWQYVGDIPDTPGADPETRQDAYSIVNLNLGVGSDDGWKIVAFVNNVLDEKYYAAIIPRSNYFAGSLATEAMLPRDFNRYFGVRFSSSF